MAYIISVTIKKKGFLETYVFARLVTLDFKMNRVSLSFIFRFERHPSFFGEWRIEQKKNESRILFILPLQHAKYISVYISIS